MNGLSALTAYRRVGAQSVVAEPNRHQAVLMLIDGAIERIAGAIGHMEHRKIAEKGQLVSRSIAIIDALRASLDQEAGGDLAANLERLYEYMTHRLLEGNMRNDPQALSEVISLLKEIRAGWVAIPQDLRDKGQGPKTSAAPSFTSQ